MTKYLGSFVGTPIAGLGFPAVSNFNAQGSDHILQRDVATIVAGGGIGDQISLGSFQRTALIDPWSAAMAFTALGAGVTANIGDVNHPNALGAAISMAAAGTSSLFSAVSVANYFLPLWQLLGYAADPGGTIELLLTFAGAAPAAGSVAWKLMGINR